MTTIINTPNAPAPIGPYSQAVQAGNLNGGVTYQTTTLEGMTGRNWLPLVTSVFTQTAAITGRDIAKG